MTALAWNRDERALRTHPIDFMKEVLDHKLWGMLFRLMLMITPLTVPIFVHLYSTLNRHSVQIENISEWRRNHQDMSNGALERLAAVEKALAARELESAVMKEKLQTIGASSEKTTALQSVISDQLIRLQQTVTEIREKTVNLQVQFDDVKSKQ